MNHQIMSVMLDAFLIINALPLKFLQKRSPTFSMVHLLHHLYGVDAPGVERSMNSGPSAAIVGL